MTVPAPSDGPFGFALSPDGAGYLACYGKEGDDTPLVRLWLPRQVVDAAVLGVAGLMLDIAADGTVMAYADRAGGQTVARASLKSLIAVTLELLDRDEDLPWLGSLEAQLERSLAAVKRARLAPGSP